MLRPAVLENEDQLMLTSIERAHSRVVFGPHAQIHELAVCCISGRQHLGQMPPVHTDKMQRAFNAIASKKREGLSQESGELGLGHLTRSHGELSVLHSPEAAHVAVDLDV